MSEPLTYSPYDYEIHEDPYPVYARLRSEAPEGSEVTVEGSVGATLESKPANPYSWFGGLGG